MCQLDMVLNKPKSAGHFIAPAVSYREERVFVTRYPKQNNGCTADCIGRRSFCDILMTLTQHTAEPFHTLKKTGALGGMKKIFPPTGAGLRHNFTGLFTVIMPTHAIRYITEAPIVGGEATGPILIRGAYLAAAANAKTLDHRLNNFHAHAQTPHLERTATEQLTILNHRVAIQLCDIRLAEI